jgi:phenylpropionate dioxygenase-like ring-hydroxylating dioxygenase large terminal subunit
MKTDIKIHNPPIRFWAETLDEKGNSLKDNHKEFMHYFHNHVSVNYPHLAQVEPVQAHGVGVHTTIIYQSKSLDDFQLGDTKKVFVVDDVKDIPEFIWAIYAEFDTDMRCTNEEIHEAIGVIFNTCFQY